MPLSVANATRLASGEMKKPADRRLSASSLTAGPVIHLVSQPDAVRHEQKPSGAISPFTGASTSAFSASKQTTLPSGVAIPLPGSAFPALPGGVTSSYARSAASAGEPAAATPTPTRAAATCQRLVRALISYPLLADPSAAIGSLTSRRHSNGCACSSFLRVHRRAPRSQVRTCQRDASSPIDAPRQGAVNCEKSEFPTARRYVLLRNGSGAPPTATPSRSVDSQREPAHLMMAPG